MTDHPVYLVQRLAGLVQHRVQAAGQGIHRKAEHCFAVHGDGGRTVPVRPTGVQDVAAPGPQREGKGGVGQPEDGRARAVAKQDAGGAVGGVHQAGKGFAPDDQGVLPTQRGQQAPRHSSAVQKAGAGRVDVQRGPVFRQAQRRLYLTGHTGGGIRGRQGGAHAAGDVCRGKAAALQRLFCGGNGQRGGGFVRGAPVPGADAGAGGDPRVTGVHGAAELFVRDRPAGQRPAGGYQLEALHAFLISPIWRYFL